MSGNTNQRTLFQTWGRAPSQNSDVQPAKGGQEPAGRQNAAQTTWSKVHQEPSDTSEELQCEDDDDLMLVAVYEAEKSLQLEPEQPWQDVSPVGKDSLASCSSTSSIPSSGQTYPDFPGFDSSSAKVWIYPTNYPIREYQLKISQAALFQNTLVCLPTGLGKTFIAAVVMYNFYRWYPSGKIVFMAPTKPLVAQQIEACYKVMGIPQAHMAELTGESLQSGIIRPHLYVDLRASFRVCDAFVCLKGALPPGRGRRYGGTSGSFSSPLRSWSTTCPERPALPDRSSVWLSTRPTKRWATTPTVR